MTIHTALAELDGVGIVSAEGTVPHATSITVHTYTEEEGGEQKITTVQLYVEEKGADEQRTMGVQFYVEEHYEHPNPDYPGEYDAGPMTQLVHT